MKMRSSRVQRVRRTRVKSRVVKLQVVFGMVLLDDDALEAQSPSYPLKGVSSLPRQNYDKSGTRSHIIHLTPLLFDNADNRDAGEAGKEPLGYRVDGVNSWTFGIKARPRSSAL